MVGGCGCGCGVWGAWCWQQLALQQREIHQLRDQLNHLEERWRVETASHTLNNQVPPGNRANNYWDNFRSYSRQNLLSANSKTNADGHLAVGPAHTAHPLVERSHNALRRAPGPAPKRNTNAPAPPPPAPAPAPQTPPPAPSPRRNLAYERSLSFSSAPDVLNVNQPEPEPAPPPPEAAPSVSNIHRQEPSPFRNLNITNPIPEIIQAHSNNLNMPAGSKKKSSSKLPAKNSSNRRNLDYAQTSNINIASTSETPNPNLASTSRENHDKATSKLFDLLRENVYSEVTTLIGVNESHPDFLIQLFRELQMISSDPLRQRVLQSIRNVLSQHDPVGESSSTDLEEHRPEVVSTTSTDANNYHECNSNHSMQNGSMQIDNKIIHFLLLKSDEICSPELFETLISLIIDSSEGRQSQQTRKRLLDVLSKYVGMRICDVSSDIIENLPFLIGSSEGDESTQLTSEVSESSILQDVAGALNLFSPSESALHPGGCPYELWGPGAQAAQDGKLDLIECSEANNDLAEADQTCPEPDPAAGDGLPDVVDTDEVTPTEAEAEWLGLDRVPTRLHMEEESEKQKE